MWSLEKAVKTEKRDFGAIIDSSQVPTQQPLIREKEKNMLGIIRVKRTGQKGTFYHHIRSCQPVSWKWCVDWISASQEGHIMKVQRRVTNVIKETVQLCKKTSKIEIVRDWDSLTCKGKSWVISYSAVSISWPNLTSGGHADCQTIIHQIPYCRN